MFWDFIKILNHYSFFIIMLEILYYCCFFYLGLVFMSIKETFITWTLNDLVVGYGDKIDKSCASLKTTSSICFLWR